MPKIIAHYHGYLRRPPVEWQFMPMMPEGAPGFAKRFPAAAAIFDNLHMLHDNYDDDVLVRPDLFPTMVAKRAAILEILPIYLHRAHGADDQYADFHEVAAEGHGAHGGHAMAMPGPRRWSWCRQPPSPSTTVTSTQDGLYVWRTPRGFFPIEVLYGALPNLQVSVGATLSTDPHAIDEPVKSGDLRLAVLYNFNQETLVMPAVGLQLEVNLPTGVDARGVALELKASSRNRSSG